MFPAGIAKSRFIVRVNFERYPFLDVKYVIEKKIKKIYKEKHHRYFERLTARKKELQSQLMKIGSIKDSPEYVAIQQEIVSKQYQKGNLGFFQTKEKKLIQQQIEELEKKAKQIESEHNKTLIPLVTQIQELDKKLDLNVDDIINEVCYSQ